MTPFYRRHQWLFDALTVVAFMLFAQRSQAQDLPQVAATGGGMWPLVLFGALVLFGIGAYIWHKRNPTQADSVLHNIISDAQAVASKAVDAAHGLQQTVAQQAAVIASPPVQAAINAQPPVATLPAATGQPMMQATAAPALMTSGEPNDPGFVPLPQRTDMYGRILPAEPFGRAPNGSGAPFATMADRAAYFKALAVHDGQQAGWTPQHAAQVYKGPVPVATLTDEEASFLLYAQEHYSTLPQGVFFAVCSGSQADIDARISWADNNRGKYDPGTYQGRMRGYVDDFANGRLKIVYA